MSLSNTFYKTGVFKWGAIITVSLGVAAVCVFSFITAGTTCVVASAIAAKIGVALGMTWTAVLATLGLGTLAAGGFGMAGGIFVIVTTTDIAITGLASFVSSAIPEDNLEGKDYSYIKIPLPKIGSEITLSNYEKIADTFEQYQDGEIDDGNYEKKMYRYYVQALNNLDVRETKYDLINGAILAYNLGEYEQSQKYLDRAKNIFPRSSYIYYHQALLNLAVDGSLSKALDNLSETIALEPDALEPYLIKIQVALDNKQYDIAKDTVLQGLDKYDDDNFQLNYLGGIIAFSGKDYKQAITYFKEALSNTTVNEIEADAKLWIAKCYQKSNNHEEAKDWYEDALDEVDHNKEYQRMLAKQYQE
ncbi:TPR domain containing protein [Beggiatoa sp. PS]|nr:TPR domain containing protein [Beggiatoa sp. PS]